jgi:hypothetical protein
MSAGDLAISPIAAPMLAAARAGIVLRYFMGLLLLYAMNDK